MRRAANIIGQRFGMLTVVCYMSKAEALAAGEKYAHYVAQCDCGCTTKVSSSTAFTAGLRHSCGCANKAAPSVARPKTAPLDLTGQRFGKLVALEITTPNPDRKRGRVWRCACDCGGEKSAETWALRAGQVQSCGCLRGDVQGHNLTGMRFGILTVVDRAETPPGGQGWHWNCKCDCGVVAVKRAKDLRNGNTASCGCMKTGTGGIYRKSELDINRPWRKADQVDDRWLVLVGERCPSRSAS